MGEVIDISSQLPHLEGIARCMSCGHEWVAVAPVGTVDLECPECHLLKGLYTTVAKPLVYAICEGCRNGLMYITPNGIECACCGKSIDLEGLFV